jgi:hypothetical protein
MPCYRLFRFDGDQVDLDTLAVRREKSVHCPRPALPRQGTGLTGPAL